MKYYLLLSFCLLLAFCSQLNSQNLTLSVTPPNPKASVQADSPDVAAHAVVKNISPSARTFFWHRTVISQTSGWSNTVCDKNFCYPNAVNVKQFTLGPGEEARLDVHVYPKGVEGKAAIDLKVTEVGNESNTMTTHYSFNQAASAATREVDKASLKVSPNPARDFFTITDNEMVHTVTVYNILGKALKTFRTVNGLKYDISELPEGLYLVRMTASNGTTIKTVRMNKQREKA